MHLKRAAIIACWLAVCGSLPEAKAERPLARYRRAIRDASQVKASEIATNLVAVVPENTELVWSPDQTKVLVTTWKSQQSYEKNILPYSQTSGNEKYVIWVTMAPYIKNFCRSYRRRPHLRKRGLDLRLKERLGLNPTWTYDVFVDLWVDPADLFRPCVDPEITDQSCALDFGAAAPVVKNIKDYPVFFKDLYYSDFHAAPGVLPWTGLGYTYDWIRLGRKGESEFIIAPGSPYEIAGAQATWEYCAP